MTEVKWTRQLDGTYTTDGATIYKDRSKWRIFAPGVRCAWYTAATLADAKRYAEAALADLAAKREAKRERKRKGRRIARALATDAPWSPELGVTEREYWCLRYRVKPELFHGDPHETLADLAHGLLQEIDRLGLTRKQRRQLAETTNELRAIIDHIADRADENWYRGVPEWLLEGQA